MADTRVADLADSGVPDVADLLYLVDVSAGPPRDRKLTIANLATAVEDEIDFVPPPVFPPGTQAFDAYLSATTTDDTPTPMSPLIPIPAGSTIVFVAYVVGRQVASGVSGAYKLEGSAGYHSETPGADPEVFSGVFRTAFSEDDAAWQATFDVDIASDSLRILVTGAPADTVEWFAHVHVIEVTA